MFETRAYDDEQAGPVVVLVVTGAHDVSRLANLLAGSCPLIEHLQLSRQVLRQVRRRDGGRSAMELLAKHGGPDLLLRVGGAQVAREVGAGRLRELLGYLESAAAPVELPLGLLEWISEVIRTLDPDGPADPGPADTPGGFAQRVTSARALRTLAEGLRPGGVSTMPALAARLDEIAAELDPERLGDPHQDVAEVTP